MSNDFAERTLARARELEARGLDPLHATGVAWLEERIRQWPQGWGDDLHVLIYGDFQPPDTDLEFAALGIAVSSERQRDTIIKGALTVLKATVRVREKSVDGLMDATKRLNLLLGARTLHAWGNDACGWWSWVTHGSSSGIMAKFEEDIGASAVAVLNLPAQARRKIEAALYWIREPRALLLESYRPDIIRVYSSYWNAFECLVYAVHVVRPAPSLSKMEKDAEIEKFFQERGGRLTSESIHDCFRSIVDMGFRAKARHALKVCFGVEGDEYYNECFALPDKGNRLYDIRNAINHGSIDAENLDELLRVEARLSRLWMIVWRIFGLFVPFPAPLDSKVPR